ncbi:MAG TPA: serine/threonine-protein kinase, partial [Kofleriaceae bacterium]|nr:serine/threonine-protein kinase [Kofleriaceae bacterium]
MSAPTAETPVTEPELDVGQLIGEYQIDGKIGQGGFGTVYKATHPLIGKQAAIKVLARRFSADPEMVSRFIAEARAVNQIRNRYIIDIFLFGQLGDGRHYYVMELLDGEPLDVRLEREGHVPLADALPILRGIGKALDAAHAKGIAHRDLKPENVFLSRGEDDEVWPKLLDFGIAKLMGELDTNKHKTRTGIPIGTPYYMSPEQCRGKDVDHRTDYYAFGVVAYQLLTGVHPIDGDDYMDIMMKQLSFEPPPPSTIIGELPAGIDDAIAWLMKKDRDARPPNLATAMRRFDEAAGIRAPHSGVVDVPRGATPVPGSLTTTSQGGAATALAQTQPGLEAEKPKRRWPLVAGAVAIAVAVAIVVLGRPSPTPTPIPIPIATATPIPTATPTP